MLVWTSFQINTWIVYSSELKSSSDNSSSFLMTLRCPWRNLSSSIFICWVGMVSGKSLLRVVRSPWDIPKDLLSIFFIIGFTVTVR